MAAPPTNPTTTVPANPAIASAQAAAALPAIDAEIDRIAGLDQDFKENYAQIFALLTNRLDALWGLLEVMVGGRPVSREYSSLQQAESEALLEMAYSLSSEAQMDSVSRAKLIPGQSFIYAAISCPIVDLNTETVAGTITLFVRVNNKDEAGSRLNYVENALARFAQRSRSKPTRVSQQTTTASIAEPPAELKALIKATQFEDLRGLCFSLVNGYCQKFGCTKTSIGIVDNNKSKVYAISGLDSLMANCPAVLDIQQAQDECLDYGQRILVQKSEREDLPASDNFLIHRNWHQNTAAAAVASVPIRVKDETVAVFSFERNVDQPFEADELDQVESSIQAFGPAIQLMKTSDLSLRAIVKQKAKKLLMFPFQNRISSAALAACLAFLLLGWLPYRPTIPCTIEASSVNHVVAPFDGVLASAPLFAGDEIKEGQTILNFDTRELEMAKDAITAQIRTKEIGRNVAMSQRKKTEAAVLDAEINALRVEQHITQRKIEQATVTSRLDGTIIRGDLREQLGQLVPKGTPLMEVAPAGSMKIQILVPESKATLIKPGHVGTFAAGSNPADRHRFTITRVMPSADLVDGQNVVLAEAEIEGQSDWMRSGMSGYANVKAGWQPVWWILGHRVIDGLRLGFWL